MGPFSTNSPHPGPCAIRERGGFSDRGLSLHPPRRVSGCGKFPVRVEELAGGPHGDGDQHGDDDDSHDFEHGFWKTSMKALVRRWFVPMVRGRGYRRLPGFRIKHKKMSKDWFKIQLVFFSKLHGSFLEAPETFQFGLNLLHGFLQGSKNLCPSLLDVSFNIFFWDGTKICILSSVFSQFRMNNIVNRGIPGLV